MIDIERDSATNAGRTSQFAVDGSTAVFEKQPDLVCLSHLRWDFVYQRPQHLLSRSANQRRVFFWEEPVFDEGPRRLELRHEGDNLWVAVPHLPATEDPVSAQRELLNGLFAERDIRQYVLWYYTPVALTFTRHLQPLLTIYDCMDELSLFKLAHSDLPRLEAELFERAQLVFTGGASLYEAKRHRHPNVYLFPSSIDMAHFGRARTLHPDPADQAAIPRPRLGFFGVIDERMDLGLLCAVADARPDWQLVMIGPVVKIEAEALPQRPNIHYLGSKPYAELPRYLAGWEVALLPFARNESTRFISPTKTPEYLAGGRPVVSTPIRDVVRPYGEQALVSIAGTDGEFIAAVQQVLAQNPQDRVAWLARVDAFLAGNSWDTTWERMWQLIEKRIQEER